MKEYLMLLLADLLLAGDFAINKVYQKKQGTSLKAGFRFNALLGLFTAVVFWILNGFQIEFTLFSALMAAGSAILITSYNLLGFRVLRNSSMAMYTLFLMTGGMIVPYVWGLLFLEEPFSFLRTLGLLLIVLSIGITVQSGKELKKATLIMCVAVFFINGFTSVINKMHQIQTELPCVSVTGFVMLSGLFKFILSGVGYLTTKGAAEEKVDFKIVLPIVLGSATASGLSYMFQLIPAENLPATVLYPFVTGGSLVLSSIAGIILFQEKVSKKLLISILLCFIGTFMFL